MIKNMDLEKIKKDLLIRKKELELELERLSSEKMSDTQSQDDGDQAQAAHRGGAVRHVLFRELADDVAPGA